MNVAKDGLTGEEASFFGDVMTAMVKQGHEISNSIEENLREDVRRARTDFVKLFRAVEQANEHVDSARVNRILEHFEFIFARAERALDGEAIA